MTQPGDMRIDPHHPKLIEQDIDNLTLIPNNRHSISRLCAGRVCRTSDELSILR